MKAKILDHNQEELWDKFVKNNPIGTIHQTTAWGKFQTRIKSRNKRWIIGVFENNKLIGGTMVIRHRLPKGYCFLYCARGPLLDYDHQDIQKHIDLITKEATQIAEEENAIFLRIDPPLKKLKKLKKFHISHAGFQPEHTLILDLTMSEEDLLKNMKQKGRYNIKLAAKKGVEIRVSNPRNTEQFTKDIDAYYEMLQETTERDGFAGHNKDVYKNMVEILSGQNFAKFYIAEQNNEILAATIITCFKDTSIYYYGVSSNKYRNLMAPYLIQWQAIKDAKKDGHKVYDFLGIAPENAKNHPWKGVTTFKKKFGGEELTLAPPQEHPFKPLMYWLYRVYKWRHKKG